MLAEGLATYSGEYYLEQGGFIASWDFCRALDQTNRMQSISAIQNSSGEFQGHILNLYNYYTAACFVGYLFEQGGPEAFEALYPTSNYTGNYGAGPGQLEVDLRNSLSSDTTPLPFDPQTLVDYYDEVRAGYERLLARSSPDQEAYLTLDRARLAVVSNDFTKAREELDKFKAMLP
jgi:hypothetical protein